MKRSYVSDTTNFLRDYLKNNPRVIEDQGKARSFWWDKPQNFPSNIAKENEKIPKKPYEYY